MRQTITGKLSLTEVLSPRWCKIARDLWGNKTRSLLVIISIAVGVFALGTILGAYTILSDGMAASYRTANPSSAIIYTIEPLDEELVTTIRNLDEVQEASGRYILSVRLQVGENEWRNLQLFAVPNYASIPINKIWPVAGAWPPPKHTIVLEQDTVALFNLHIGDDLLIETPDRKQRSLPVVGVAHELPLYPSELAGIGYGYITFDTLERLGVPYGFNELLVIATQADDAEGIRLAINRVQDRLQENNIRVRDMVVPVRPGRHPGQDITEAILVVLGVLGLLVLFLSIFLVTNTMSAVLAQQTRQIGIMKAAGARVHQLVLMYITLSLIFGLVATALAMPFSVFGARQLALFALDVINFNIPDFDIPWQVYGLQIAIGLVTPVAAGLSPVMRGTRISVREAIAMGGSQTPQPEKKVISRLFQALLQTSSQFLSRPLVLSLRNTFRNSRRMVLTLITLALGCAIVIAVISVYRSTVQSLNDAAQYWQYDVEITLEHSVRMNRILQAASSIPGVEQVEGWGLYSTRRIRQDGSESTTIQLLAPYSGTQFVKPILVTGRWLVAQDENAIVVDTDLLRREPDITVGSDIRLKVKGNELVWRVVGVVKGQYRGFPVVYVNYPYFANQTIHDFERAVRVLVVGKDPLHQSQSTLASTIEKEFKRRGIKINLIETVDEVRSRVQNQFNIVMVFLIMMATLMAVVGGCGLTGTMSINVMERTHEIAVMRTIGATGRAIQWLVLSEGLLIGLLSWALGSLLAWPLSKFLSDAVGIAMTQAPLNYRFPLWGILLCLLEVLILCLVATGLPAWNASQISIKDALAYE